MEPADAADSITEVAEEDEAEEAQRQRKDDERFRRRVAVLIGVLAMLLAITGLGGDDAATQIVNANIQASDTWAFYQAKNVRQTSTQLAADEMELMLASQPNLPPEARADVERRLERYRATIARYESEPYQAPDPRAPGEGKRELSQKAQAFEEERDHAQRQDPNFDYAEALFQIAIVLASVSIVATSRPLLAFSLVLGAIAAVLMINGFFLFFDLPIG